MLFLYTTESNKVQNRVLNNNNKYLSYIIGGPVTDQNLAVPDQKNRELENIYGQQDIVETKRLNWAGHIKKK